MADAKLSAPSGEAERMQERRTRVWTLRTQGKSIYKISAELTALGFSASPTTVSVDLQHTLAEFRELEGSSAQEWRDTELARLDEIIESQMARMNLPNNVRSADNAVAAKQAIEAKAKLLGINAPEDINITGKPISDLFRIAKKYLEERES